MRTPPLSAYTELMSALQGSCAQPGRSFSLCPWHAAQLSQGLQYDYLQWSRPLTNDRIFLKQGGSYVSASAAGSLKKQYKSLEGKYGFKVTTRILL